MNNISTSGGLKKRKTEQEKRQWQTEKTKITKNTREKQIEGKRKEPTEKQRDRKRKAEKKGIERETKRKCISEEKRVIVRK